jgi:hypothetical protein
MTRVGHGLFSRCEAVDGRVVEAGMLFRVTFDEFHECCAGLVRMRVQMPDRMDSHGPWMEWSTGARV